MTAWAGEHFADVHPRQVMACAAWMRGHGIDPVTPDAMRTFAEQHPRWGIIAEPVEEPAA